MEEVFKLMGVAVLQLPSQRNANFDMLDLIGDVENAVSQCRRCEMLLAGATATCYDLQVYLGTTIGPLSNFFTMRLTM